MTIRAPQQHRRRKFNDLSGKTFGHIKVLYRTNDRVNKSGKIEVWYQCLCDCGREYDAPASRFKNADETASCGCRRYETVRKRMQGKNLQDLIGQVFGRWTVIDRAESRVSSTGRKTTMWHCRCTCGVEKDLAAGSLKNGDSKSCGCLKIESLSKNRDLVGSTFGRWSVVRRGEDVLQWGRLSKAWFCECECGATRDVLEQSLLRGRSISCGCYRIEQRRETAVFEDLTGKVFNQWTVLSRTDDRFYPGGGRSQMWLCRCMCGSENAVAGIMLRQGISQSCGCLHGSIQESHVRDFLLKNDFQFESQKTFDGLVGVGGGPLSYDFLVFKDTEPWLLIECQGEQHFRPVEYFGGESRFAIQQEHDRRKRAFTVVRELTLLEIPYTARTAESIGELLVSGPFQEEVFG